jgi:mannitol-specific phosphotransferase system IIBC component
MPEEERKTITREVVASVVAALIVAMTVNAVGFYVQMQLNNQRIDTLEQSIVAMKDMVERNKVETDANRDRFNDRLSDIQRDVSFIRGTLEQSKATR